MNITDIEGTKARHRHPSRSNPEKVKEIYNPMDYRDVTNCDFKSTRTTNPLVPSYVVRDENKSLTEIGPIIGNVPCALPPPRQDQEFVAKSLKTKDIHGCAIGTKGLGNFHTRERREYKVSNVTADIIGAQPSTLKKSPTTERCTHPLMPDYQYPGRHELTNINDGFGKRNAVQ